VHVTLERMLRENADMIESTRSRLSKKLDLSVSKFILKSTESAVKHGRSGLRLVTAKFSADGDNVELSYAFKYFRTEQEATMNKKAINELLDKISNTEVSTAKVICQEGKVLVFEGLEGQNYTESTLNLDKKLYLAGKALATYHGPRLNKIDKERYLIVLETTIAMLPIPEERRIKLRDRGKALINNALEHYTGITGYGDFHEGNVMFNDTGSKIYLVDPEYKEREVAACRLEDVATFFLDQSLRLMSRTNTLEIEGVFEKFFAGYESYMTKFGISFNQILGSRERLYAAMFFQLGLSNLLEALYAYKKAGGDVDNRGLERMTLCLRVANKSFKRGIHYLELLAAGRSVVRSNLAHSWN